MYNQVSSERTFHNSQGTMLTINEVLADIRVYIESHPKSRFEIVIGSDSEAALAGSAMFVTALVVRRVGNGGIYFWTRHEEKFFAFKDRIWKEAMMSITLAQELRSLLKDALGEEMFWAGQLEFRCVHLDIGEAGPTKELIDGICGMVKGYGFEPVIKPYSYGAFVVADRHT